jgi:hypothetical protein
MRAEHDNPAARLANGRSPVAATRLFSFSWWYYFAADRRQRA